MSFVYSAFIYDIENQLNSVHELHKVFGKFLVENIYICLVVHDWFLVEIKTNMEVCTQKYNQDFVMNVSCMILELPLTNPVDL